MDWAWDIIESYRNNTLSSQNIDMKAFTDILTSLSNTQAAIPSDEVDEFNSVYEAYRKLKGNHNREKKYNYVTNNLPIIPVTTLYNNDQE